MQAELVSLLMVEVEVRILRGKGLEQVESERNSKPPFWAQAQNLRFDEPKKYRLGCPLSCPRSYI